MDRNNNYVQVHTFTENFFPKSWFIWINSQTTYNIKKVILHKDQVLLHNC